MAPEVILHKPYNYKCDVYSYGVLLWETLHRLVPFNGFAPLQAAFAVAMEQARPPISLREELQLYAPLITSCWDTDPALRPGMDQVVAATRECLATMEAAAEAVAAEGKPAEEEPGKTGRVSGIAGALASKLSLSGRRSSPED